MKSYKLLISTTLIAGIYIILIMMLMNSSLVKDTILGNYKFVYKYRIISGLVQGMWTSMSEIGVLLLLTTAILTGLNLSLLSEKIKNLRKEGSLKIVVGGSSLLGIISSGCTACGLPILTLLGLGGSVVFLPFRGAELSYLSVVLLLVSLYYLIKVNNKNECLINEIK